MNKLIKSSIKLPKVVKPTNKKKRYCKTLSTSVITCNKQPKVPSLTHELTIADKFPTWNHCNDQNLTICICLILDQGIPITIKATLI